MILSDNLDREEKLLVEIAKAYLNNRSGSFGDRPDWNKLSVLAQKHQLSAIVYYHCRNLPGSDILKDSYYATISTSANRKKIYQVVTTRFEENGIDYIPYKGIIIADYYPQPLCRTMGDVDILVSDIDKAIEVMNTLGFSGKRNREEWGGTKNGIEFEIHSKFFCNNISLTDKQKGFFEEYDNYVNDHKLDSNYHFLLVVCHLMKHIKNGQGIGLRQFLDVALMMKNEEGLNWEWIFEHAEEIELLQFLNVTLNFVNRLFNVQVPSQTTLVSEETLQVLLENIISDGSFQSNGIDRAVAKRVNGTDKIDYIAALFPPISQLQEKYVYLQKVPILLPYAWIERIFRFIFAGKRSKKRKDCDFG